MIKQLIYHQNELKGMPSGQRYIYYRLGRKWAYYAQSEDSRKSKISKKLFLNIMDNIKYE